MGEGTIITDVCPSLSSRHCRHYSCACASETTKTKGVSDVVSSALQSGSSSSLGRRRPSRTLPRGTACHSSFAYSLPCFGSGCVSPPCSLRTTTMSSRSRSHLLFCDAACMFAAAAAFAAAALAADAAAAAPCASSFSSASFFFFRALRSNS